MSKDILGKKNPSCAGSDKRMTTHHIDYDKTNNNFSNLNVTKAVMKACKKRTGIWGK